MFLQRLCHDNAPGRNYASRHRSEQHCVHRSARPHLATCGLFFQGRKGAVSRNCGPKCACGSQSTSGRALNELAGGRSLDEKRAGGQTKQVHRFDNDTYAMSRTLPSLFDRTPTLRPDLRRNNMHETKAKYANKYCPSRLKHVFSESEFTQFT